jgi:endonuclease/exonuclease/phosphatase family metal-dependent hydrolase
MLASLILAVCGRATFAVGTNQLTLLTWNLHGGNPADSQYPAAHPSNNCYRQASTVEMDQFVQVIRRYNASHARKIDVITLQEVKRWQVTYLRDHLRDSQSPYVAYFLKTKTCFCNNDDNAYGNAIITRLPISAPTGYTLSPLGPPENHACRENDFEYTKLGGYSVRVPTGQWVRIYNAHLSGINAASTTLATQQIWETLIYILLGDANAAGQPRAIIAGDFNAYPTVEPCHVNVVGSNPYSIITSEWPLPTGRFIDAWVERPDPTNRCGYTAGTLNLHKRFDYIFRRRSSGLTTDHIEVLRPSVISGLTIPDKISDHLPIVVDLSF